MQSLKTHKGLSNKIYNSELTNTQNMKSSTVQILGRSTENTVDFDRRVDLVKL